jgi:GMP synthase (glutamine-hydrolysing)
MQIPILGICYGHQIIVNNFGGKVKRVNKEYGSAVLSIDDNSDIFSGVGGSIRAWMSHGDEAKVVPDNFEIIGHTENARAAAISNKQKDVYGIQFHPEVVHTENGNEILKNFVLKVCHANQDWTLERFVENSIENISKLEGNVGVTLKTLPSLVGTTAFYLILARDRAICTLLHPPQLKRVMFLE